MSWPLGPSPGAGADYHAVSGFVDLNLAYPNLSLEIEIDIT